MDFHDFFDLYSFIGGFKIKKNYYDQKSDQIYIFLEPSLIYLIQE